MGEVSGIFSPIFGKRRSLKTLVFSDTLLLVRQLV
jgi:hypothetical protein